MVQDTVSGNPLTSDPALKGLLEKLPSVYRYDAFCRWRNSFLKIFESFLEEGGINGARVCYEKFSKSMEKLAKQVHEVEKLVDKGALSSSQVSVKAWNALNEMNNLVRDAVQLEEKLAPSTSAQEKKLGYNKYHLGAVLVRDEFAEYERMTTCGETLKRLKDVCLTDIADKQILEEIDSYQVQWQRFCDLMADLGLYEVMLKSREFAGGKEGNFLLFVDLKTGCIGAILRKVAVEKGVIKVLKDDQGNEKITDGVRSHKEITNLVDLLRENPLLGFGGGDGPLTMEEQAVKIQEIERIKNLWGVTLRSRPKNIKGEEFIFVDTKSAIMGELSRKDCVQHGVITVLKDKNGKEFIGEAATEREDRDELMELLRTTIARIEGESQATEQAANQ